jgi:hypothetical protein
MEAFSIASAVVSIVLGIYAIWLSVVFYRMSVKSSTQIQESSKDLSSSVSKLEKLFEHLYSDTFSMMRDTYSDMRKHVWPDAIVEKSEIGHEIEARADIKIDRIRDELMGQIESMATQVGGTEARMEEIRKELRPLVENAITQSRSAEAEAQEETLRNVLVSRLREAGRNGATAIKLYDFVVAINEGWRGKFFDEIRALKNEGIVAYDTDDVRGYPASSDRIFYLQSKSSQESR